MVSPEDSLPHMSPSHRLCPQEVSMLREEQTEVLLHNPKPTHTTTGRPPTTGHLRRKSMGTAHTGRAFGPCRSLTAYVQGHAGSVQTVNTSTPYKGDALLTECFRLLCQATVCTPNSCPPPLITLETSHCPSAPPPQKYSLPLGTLAE